VTGRAACIVPRDGFDAGGDTSADNGGEIESVTRFISRQIGIPAFMAVLALVAAIPTAGTAAASSGPRRPALARPAGATVIVRSPDTSASAVVGDDVRVELVACAASCGYTWRVTKGPAASVARYVSTKYRRSPASRGVVGGNEIEDVTFRAIGPGTTPIVFGYFPPGRDRQPTRSYRLQLRVDCAQTDCPAPGSGKQ
jgi:hypothetical protein